MEWTVLYLQVGLRALLDVSQPIILHIMGDCVDPCKPEACAIQDCLKKNGYNESKCTAHIDRLYACCKQFYKREGTEARSPCCPTPKLLKFKMEQREQEKLDAKLL